MSEFASILNYLYRLSKEPGSVFDTAAALARCGADHGLSGYTLFISARGAMCVGSLYTAPKPYIVRIPIPEGKTVVDLMAALYNCPLPAAILHHLRTTPGADKYIGPSLRPMIDEWSATFLDVLEKSDGIDMLGWILDMFEVPI